MWLELGLESWAHLWENLALRRWCEQGVVVRLGPEVSCGDAWEVQRDSGRLQSECTVTGSVSVCFYFYAFELALLLLSHHCYCFEFGF